MATYTYRLVGIKNDGSDDIINISASCETEAEIIIESFHNGCYELLSEPDDHAESLYLEQYMEEQYEKWLQEQEC